MLRDTVLAGALAAGLVVNLALPALAADAQFFSTLDPAPMTMATRANVAGAGSVSAELNGNKLSVQGSFSGLASAATKAELRSGSMIGVPGDVFANLTITPAADGSLSGTVSLDRAKLKALRDGAVYVQINDEKAPDGALRAWLVARQP